MQIHWQTNGAFIAEILPSPPVGVAIAKGYITIVTNRTYIDGLWHHVQFVRMGTLYSIYVDGVKDAEGDMQAVVDHNQNTKWWFGGYPIVQAQPDNRFHGAIGKCFSEFSLDLNQLFG